eukprot:9001910-Pyramimonas_sp.AAC.1
MPGCRGGGGAGAGGDAVCDGGGGDPPSRTGRGLPIKRPRIWTVQKKRRGPCRSFQLKNSGASFHAVNFM